MKTIASMLMVVFSLTALCVFPVCAQRSDPFGGSAVPGDPFARQPPPKGVPVKIVLSVVDHQNAPVPGAVIDVRNHDSKNRARSVAAVWPILHTNAKGLATWRTSDQQLAKFAALNRGMLLFGILPPQDSPVPRMLRGYKLGEINQGKQLKFKGRDGVRIRGNVIGKTDRAPVKGAHVYVTKKGSPDSKVGNWRTMTDPEGNWSIVVPRVDTVQVVCSGHVEGYNLESAPEHRKLADVAAQAAEITVPAFEIKQLLPRTGQVLDENGKPVRDALISSTYDRWLTPDFLQFETLASRTQSNSEGRFAFTPHRPNWEVGIVRGQATVDGVACGGRVTISESVDEPIDIRLRPLSRVSGKLSDGKQPSAGTTVVIYEAVKVPGKPQGWVTVGLRGEAKTDKNGAFEFFVERHVHYIIASQDESGRQTTRYRVAEKVGVEGLDVEVNLQSVP